ncbi:hypothetical protein TBLA_0A06640 [Henningerozyma blattae CBS 6284]|uniref:Enoyl reductase (ER) domain-containing protein n=1 Tax=Henningerozyma blattae (strain ATCC 34711 / CBS 6284 / DSM 70876 / NBRC 10599 / NRRL Y-10934 / UCD 77-7) TaxID=1071380 RepID=I2GWF4_HENB6|nr:hypothetical protein TBLA_0A06640 [Tetrapisispora blattae CBS 6284]CCH58456.1 hypothetical protein TBLA_0A06640 [Tetrapisispora blattae CBS 6284]
MSYPEKFQGIAVVEREDWLNPKKVSYDPKTFGEQDIDIEIMACGVCGSDTHTAASRWGPCPNSQVVGHEIIGKVVKIGSKCEDGLKIGQRVGVGAQVFSCLECQRCKNNNEQYCTNFVTTYTGIYPNGYIAQGGYASHIRVHEHFVIPIPDEIPTELAAPLMCGGATVFTPLLRNGCGPNKKVGIIGIGGIGHMGILLAKAMGAEVYAFSRGENKRADAMDLGADHYYATGTEGWDKDLFNTLDLAVICASSLTDINLDQYIKIMKIGGSIQSISVPDVTEKLTLRPFQLVGITIGNSLIGTPQDIKTMLDIVVKNNVKIWIEKVPVGEKGVHEAWSRLEKGDVRYRFVLTDFEKEFGSEK